MINHVITSRIICSISTSGLLVWWVGWSWMWTYSLGSFGGASSPGRVMLRFSLNPECLPTKFFSCCTEFVALKEEVIVRVDRAGA